MHSDVDERPFAYFRIFFGILMGWQIWTVLTTHRLIDDFLVSKFYFTYPGFDWIQPLNMAAMQNVIIMMFVASLCFTIGLLYRISSIVLFSGYLYIFILDQTLFFQQFYLIILLLFLMIWIPAHKTESIDSIFNTKIPAPQVWQLWAVRFQLAVVYIFAGLFKLNADWLTGEPIRTWFPEISSIGVWIFVYGGILFNLCIIPLLLYRKTNTLGLILVCIFHITNELLFNIAIFPWIMLVPTVLFFYPQRVTRNPQPHYDKATRGRPVTHNNTLKTLCTLYIAVQILVPLRTFLYPGDSSWTEEGRKFSWQMMLSYKNVESFQMYSVNPTTQKRRDIDLTQYINEFQSAVMIRNPLLTAQFARWISTKFDPPAEIYAQTLISFNGREPKDMIDTTVDLSKTTRRILPGQWIKAL
ncbi:MAG: HTTM domain-containing protein [bacterium]|nr:HTTM domain-containing protein [bacterium]